MAINNTTLPAYNGQVNAPTPEYPYGSARDDVVPGDLTGTPRVAAEINDLKGWQQALLAQAGIVPSGDPDEVGASQYQDALNQLFGPKDANTPVLLTGSGQSNFMGPNSGGPNPASAGVFAWDGGTNDWGGSDITGLPWTQGNPDGNSGNNNALLALAHRIHDETGRLVYIVFDGVGGTSITEWTDTGTASTRYKALTDKVALALASPELAGVTVSTAFHWQQGEEDFNMTFDAYLADFTTLITQLRGESWMQEITPILCGGPSELHERYEPKRAQRFYCNKLDAFCVWINSAGLETFGDATHFSGDSLWELGYYRLYAGMMSAPKLTEIELALQYGRGTGPATPEDTTWITKAQTIIGWGCRTSDFPANCDVNPQYAVMLGQNNKCGNHSAVFGLDNVKDPVENARYSFHAGRGHVPTDDYSSGFGGFPRYITPEADAALHQFAIGTSVGNRRNAVTIRESGTVEIYTPSTANDPEQDEEIVCRRVDNFTLQIAMRGTDSIVRTVDLTLL